jgi:hypothetical protein
VAQVVGRRPPRDLWCGHGYEYLKSEEAAWRTMDLTLWPTCLMCGKASDSRLSTPLPLAATPAGCAIVEQLDERSVRRRYVKKVHDTQTELSHLEGSIGTPDEQAGLGCGSRARSASSRSDGRRRQIHCWGTHRGWGRGWPLRIGFGGGRDTLAVPLGGTWGTQFAT